LEKSTILNVYITHALITCPSPKGRGETYEIVTNGIVARALKNIVLFVIFVVQKQGLFVKGNANE
jgi:hypothetical protein